MEEIVIRVLKEFGVPIGLVVFFVYRDWKRENRWQKGFKLSKRP